MITESNLYWITRLDSLHGIFVVMLIISCFASIVALFFLFDSYSSRDDENEKKVINFYWFCVIPMFVLALLGEMFVPTTKEMCAIKVIPAIAQNKTVQGISEKAVAATEAWLDGIINTANKKDK